MEYKGGNISILGGLDADSLHQLESQQTDFDGIFQGGGNPNNFGAGVAAASDLLTGKIVQQMMAVIGQEVEKYLALKIQSLALSAADIVGVADQLVAKYTLTFGDIMTELTKDATEQMNDLRNPDGTAVKAMTEEASNLINGLVTDLKNKINKKIDINKITEKVNSILNYAAQGPIWLESQLVALATMIVKSIQKEIDNSSESIAKQKEELVNKLASNIALQQAEIENEKLRQTARNTINEANRLKISAEITAEAASREALLQLAAILGL